MKEKFKSFVQNKSSQIILYALFVIITSTALYLSQKSVVAFLLLLASLLVLYYMNFKNLTKWIGSVIYSHPVRS